MLFGRKRKTENAPTQPPVTKIDMNDPAFKAMIDEAIEVINDIQQIGHLLSMFQNYYSGGIGIFVRSEEDRNVARYWFEIITMNTENVDDIMDNVMKNCPRMFTNPENHHNRKALSEFSQKYRPYYSKARMFYDYISRNTVTSLPGQNEAIEAIVYKEAENRCPLSELPVSPGGIIYSTNVWH